MTKKTEAQILQQIQEAVNNVAEEITANHEITKTRWNPIAQQMDIDINITLIQITHILELSPFTRQLRHAAKDPKFVAYTLRSSYGRQKRF